MRDFTFKIIATLVTFSISVFAIFFWLNENKTQYNQAIESLSPKILELNQPNQILNPNEEYEVYSSILSNEYFEPTFYVIGEKTAEGSFSDFDPLKNQASDLTQEVFQDFNKKNRFQIQLTNNFQVKGKVILVNETEQKRIFKTGQLTKLYPKAESLITFSRVGFNSSQTQALVQVSTWCGLLCGQSKIVFLQKNKNKWTVARTIRLFIS
jgi:hypothetical protein